MYSNLKAESVKREKNEAIREKKAKEILQTLIDNKTIVVKDLSLVQLKEKYEDIKAKVIV